MCIDKVMEIFREPLSDEIHTKYKVFEWTKDPNDESGKGRLLRYPYMPHPAHGLYVLTGHWIQAEGCNGHDYPIGFHCFDYKGEAHRYAGNVPHFTVRKIYTKQTLCRGIQSKINTTVVRWMFVPDKYHPMPPEMKKGGTNDNRKGN